MARLIDADALADDLLYDAELCSVALDDTDIVGKDRERLQWEKDCKQNCVFYLTESPTIDAIPVEWLEWRVMNAKYNGIKEAEDAFDFVLNCWKEQEAR